MYILAALVVGFIAGVLFRDAYTIIHRAIKEYKEEMEPRPDKKRRWPIWTVVIFFSLFQIALGAGVTYVVVDAADTQDCLVEVAESSRTTRVAAIDWVENFVDQIQHPNVPQEQQLQQFVTKSDDYVAELKGDNEQISECLDNAEDGSWLPIE